MVTLFLGYGLYQSVQRAEVLQQQASPGITSINASVGNLSSGIIETIRSGAYYLVEVVILFLFASIGYKIALIGMEINEGIVPSGRNKPNRQENGQG